MGRCIFHYLGMGAYLYGLSVLMEDVDPNNRLVELRIGRLDNFIILVFRICQSIKSSEHKLKHCG